MKLTITLGLLVLAIGAHAQQSTTSTKKAKANANTTTIKATTETTAPAVVPAPAAGASTATLPAAAPTKRWGVTLVNEMNTTNEGSKNLDTATITTINYLGASYKVTDKYKAGLRQYVDYVYNPKETTESKQSFTVATLSTKTKGLLGSDDISPQLWYYTPGDTAEKNVFGKNMDHFYGILRLDAEVNWTLNPKWSVSYYFNPRQTLGAVDTEANFEATSRLVHYGTIYYNINDNVQTYFNAGFDHRMSSEKQTSIRDTYLSAVGMAFSFLGGKLAFYPEINTTVDTKTTGKTVAAPRFYQSDDIGYTLATVIAL